MFGLHKRNTQNRAILFQKKEIINGINDIRPLQIIPLAVKILEKNILHNLSPRKILH